MTTTLTPQTSTAKPPIDSAIELTTSADSSVHEVHKTVAEILPGIIERAAHDEYFRESLLADPESTINSVLARTAGTMAQLPAFVRIKVLEDSESLVNLVIPIPSNNFAGSQLDSTTLLAILTAASSDMNLREDLLNDPKAVIERELSARTGQAFKLDENVDLNVEAEDVDQIVIVLSPRIPSNVAWNASEEGQFSKDGLSPMAASTNYDTCRYTNDYCQTSFTQCGNGCGTSGCITHTYECRR